jgi:glutamyl-tRNA synthetase
VTQVVRGRDLAGTTPRQAWLADTLGVARPEYAHVPLVLGPDGARLSKRHGPVTVDEIGGEALPLLAESLGLARPGERASAAALLERFDAGILPSEPFTFSPH